MTQFVIIVIYLGVLLFVTRYAHVAFSRHTSGDYFLASRSIGPFLLIMSILFRPKRKKGSFIRELLNAFLIPVILNPSVQRSSTGLMIMHYL